MNKYLFYVQILYALLIPAQIFAALKFQIGEYTTAWVIIIGIMGMEAVGIKYWIIAQSHDLQSNGREIREEHHD
jgi:hypothetical protein